MTTIDTRHIPRDSLLMIAKLRLPDSETEYQVKIRNLSACGMMARNGPAVELGANLEVNLRNIGWIAGRVAWVQGDCFGIAFSQEIDEKKVRSNEPSDGYVAPRFTKIASSGYTSGSQSPGTGSQRLRKL